MSSGSLRGLARVCALAIGMQLLLPVAQIHARDESAPQDRHGVTLTLEEALELAAVDAPQVEAARARVAQTEALREEAALTLRDNPVLDLEAGPRLGGEQDASAVVGVGWSQSFELGGQRDARIEVAEASAARAEALADVTARDLQAEVGLAFLEAVAARQRLEVAEASRDLTAEIVAIEQRKLEAGDVSELDGALASLALERADAEAALVAARYHTALAELRALLGLDPDVALDVEGTLDDYLPQLDHDALLMRVAERPELRALDAELAEATALETLAGAEGWPDLAVRLGYEFEEDAHAVLGSVAFTLPLFDGGQGTEARAVAQASAARIEAASVEHVASTRTEALYDVYTQLLTAVGDYETDALDLVERTETMAQTAYEAGAVPLAELLTMRRELVAAQTTHIDLLLNAALAAFELRIAAGDLP